MTIVLLTLLTVLASAGFIWCVFRWPDYFFWIFLLLLLDPTGAFTIHLSKEALGGVYYQDFFFILVFLPLLSPRVDIRGIWKDPFFKAIMVAQLVFFIYHLFVYGLIVPGNSWNDYVRFFLIRWRMSIFGFLVLVPVYIMAKRKMSVLVDLLAFLTAGIFIVFFISLLIDVEVFPVMQFERYRGSGIMRYSLFKTGLADYTIPLALFVFLMKVPYRFRNVLFVAASLTFVSIVIALTKSVYVSLFAYLFTAFFLIFKLFNFPLMTLFRRGFLFSSVLVIALFITFPQYVDYSIRVGKDIYLFIIGEPYTSGKREARLENQVPAHLSIIRQAPFFGAGAFSDRYASLKFDESDYEISDLPITGHLAYYGIVGILIYCLFYLQIIKVMRKVYLFIKSKSTAEFLKVNRLEIGMVVVAFAFFFKTFIFRPNYLFKEITYDRFTINIMLGLMLAAFYRMRLKEGKKTEEPMVNVDQTNRSEDQEE